MHIQSKYINQIPMLFEKKKWNKRADYEEKLQRCIHLFAELKTEQERELVFTLLGNIELVEENQYIDYYSLLLEKLSRENDKWFKKLKIIYIAPLVERKNYKNTKSSNVAWYILRNNRFCFHRLLRNKIINFVDVQELDNLKRNKLKANSCLILIDDYIGSGNTAKKVIDEFNCIRENKDQLVIFSLAAEREGINLISRFKIKMFYAIEVKKGISDRFQSNEKDKMLNLMKKIENDIYTSLDEDWSLGYNNSESLVIMIRASNNVFPIFWMGKKAIFERRKSWRKHSK